MDPDDLYGLPLYRFVAERSALARALRADQRRDEATAVAGLRKPSVAAWAVNQLVRSQASAVKELFEAGDALREAQADLLAGRGDGRALRAARERERTAVDGLVNAARGLLTSEGHELSATVVERVGDTLHAAALDEDAREQVRLGRLERELRHVGLGLGEATLAASPAKTGRSRTQPRKAARAAEIAARRREERSASALRAAEQRRERAAQALAAADEALAAARADAEAATDEHHRARADLEAS